MTIGKLRISAFSKNTGTMSSIVLTDNFSVATGDGLRGKCVCTYLLINFCPLTVPSETSRRESFFLPIIKQFLCIVCMYFVPRSVGIHRKLKINYDKGHKNTDQPWRPLLHLEQTTPRWWNHLLVWHMRLPPTHAQRMGNSNVPI